MSSLGSPSDVRSPRRRPAARVLVDTNILLLMARDRFPLVAEVHRLLPGARIGVPSSVVGEMERLARDRTAGAELARSLADRFESVPTRARGDAGVVDAARTTGAWVATADRALQERLRATGTSVLVPRDRSRLEPLRGTSSTPRRAPRRPRKAPRRGNS